jgi:hypothetical protein
MALEQGHDVPQDVMMSTVKATSSSITAQHHYKMDYYVRMRGQVGDINVQNMRHLYMINLFHNHNNHCENNKEMRYSCSS